MSGPRLPRVGPILACVALACGDAPARAPGSATIDTVDGVVYVRNEGDGLWGPGEAWTLDIDLQLGSLDDGDEAQFASALVAAVHGADGHILVLDHMAAHILEFDAAGGLVRQFGRRGEGPGEFVGPSGVTVDGSGRVWAADVFPPRYSVFAPDGELEGVYRRPVRYVQRRAHQLPMRSDGRLIDYAVTTSRDDVVFLAAEAESETADTIASAPLPVRIAGPSTPGPSRPAMSKVGMHLLPTFTWTWSPVDDSFWVAWADGERLVNLSPTGDTLRVIEVAHRPRPLTDEEEAVVAEALRETGLSRGEMNIVPSVVMALRVTNDGHLLVFVTPDPVDLDASLDSATTMEVYDPEGRFLGSLGLGFTMPRVGVPSVRGDTLLAPILGDLDATFVVRALIQRP